MRALDTQYITTTAGMPIKKGTLDHVQLAYKEALDALSKRVLLSTTGVHILFGCVLSGSAGNYNVSAGAVYYNGEIYLVDAATAIDDSGANEIVGVLATTYYTTDADPVTFDDANTHNVHEIKKVVVQAGLSGSGIANYLDWSKHIDTVYNSSATATGVLITGGSYQDLRTYTTPNDGITRNYMLLFKGIWSPSNGVIQVEGELRMYNTSDSVLYDTGLYAHVKATAGDVVRTSITSQAIVSIGPNKTIKVQAKAIVSDATIEHLSFLAMEIKI